MQKYHSQFFLQFYRQVNESKIRRVQVSDRNNNFREIRVVTPTPRKLEIISQEVLCFNTVNHFLLKMFLFMDRVTVMQSFFFIIEKLIFKI